MIGGSIYNGTLDMKLTVEWRKKLHDLKWVISLGAVLWIRVELVKLS
jgi:hypothetical protein